jgi:hypothetical protein
MAFIREYAAMSGDPGRRRGFFRRAFKAPRFIRKIQPGHLLKPLAGFVPGGSTILSAAELAGFAGDPGPKRGKAPKRKGAASGPRQKAKKKREHRQKKGGGLGAALGQLDYGALGQAALGAIPVVGGVVSELAGQLGRDSGGVPLDLGGGVPIAGASQVMLPDGSAGLVPHGVKHRMPTLVHRRVDSWMRRPGRAMNFSNVKALRKGIRRLEGFERIVKAVERAYPRIKRAVHHSAPHRKGKR